MRVSLCIIGVFLFSIARGQGSESITLKESSILILKLYTADNFLTTDLQRSLNAEGFMVKETDTIPSSDSLAIQLKKFGQLWVVSDYERHLDSSYLEVLKSYLDSGNALYILADNEPYNADANFLAKNLTGAEFGGNFLADMKAKASYSSDLACNVVDMYEGFTVSSISMPESVKPQFIGSEGQVFIASFHHYKYKILLDGGFTRMYTKWNAGSETYFVNAAVWLRGG